VSCALYVQVFDKQPHLRFSDSPRSRKYSDIRVTDLDSEETRINISRGGVQNKKKNLRTSMQNMDLQMHELRLTAHLSTVLYGVIIVHYWECKISQQ